jgi:DNA (cytosine-5)-methyltransferase 1
MGSLFSGCGGLDLGLERAFGGSLETVWQVEKEPFCRKVLERHWPHAKRYDDVRTVGAHNLEPVDVLCGGFPCQSISVAGKQEGLANEEKSGLWWEFHRIISELRPKVVVLENVANILRVGGTDVVGSLAQIGYDCEWTVISARQFGAPHLRERWFGVAFPKRIGLYLDNERRNSPYSNQERSQVQPTNTQQTYKKASKMLKHSSWRIYKEESTTYSNGERQQEQSRNPFPMEQNVVSQCRSSQTSGTYSGNHWEGFPTQSPVCRRDDGVPNRVDRIKALGNAVVPQCAEWVGQQIINSNLLEVACSTKN